MFKSATMNIKNLLFFTILYLSTQPLLFSQFEAVSDYLVLNTGDTLLGEVEHVDERGASPEYFRKIRFTNTNGKRFKYRRENVSAFRISHVDYEGFWLSQSSEKIVLVNPRYDITSQEGEQYFLRLIKKGPLSHYHLEWYDQGDAGLNWMDLLRKKGDPFFIRATQGILGLKRKVLTYYFQDCPDIRQQIQLKQLNEVEQVVDFYNSSCVE